MTSAGGSPPGASGYSGVGGPPAASGNAAPPGGGGNGLAAEVHTLERAIFEVKRIIVGQDQLVERMLVGLLSRGHVLLEGVPGVAKTLAVETFARVVGGTFARIQFTPDLVPTDIVGTRIYRQGKEEFDTELGPVVVNFLLADEINRAPAKVQSALLEVMQERHVSIGGKTFALPNPFLVMATQNPIEHEGVYPLPEAQRDRFLFKINVGYPSPEEEREIIYRMGVKPPEPKQILNTGDLLRLQEIAANNFVHHALVDYVVRVITATRHPEQFGMNDVKAWISFGASPRASLGIIAASRVAGAGARPRLRHPARRRRGDSRRAAAPVGAHLRRAGRRNLAGDRHQPNLADGRHAAGECCSATRPFGASGDAGCWRGQRSVTDPVRRGEAAGATSAFDATWADR